MNIYLDNASTTKVSEDVCKAVFSNILQVYGNPSSIHRNGREAHKAVDSARYEIAKALNSNIEEVYFTSGGTESDNTAIKGVAFQNLNTGKRNIVTSAIEHPAVLETCKWLSKFGFTHTQVPISPDGVIDLEALEHAVTDETMLVSVMAANNEIGTIQPIKKVAKIAHAHKALFHTDAVQAFGAIPIDVKKCGIDLLSISGHKLHALKGIGALYVKSSVKIDPLLHGGGQESGLRSGTENVDGIIALGVATRNAVQNMEQSAKRKEYLRSRLLAGIESLNINFRINGTMKNRLSGNLNVSFPDNKIKNPVVYLDYKGVSCSSGSACSANSNRPSYVLKSIGLSPAECENSIRFTIGEDTTEEEIDYVIDVIKEMSGAD